MKIKKAVVLITVLVALAAVLSGCGNIAADITLNEDNSITSELFFQSFELASTKVYLEEAKEYLREQGYEIADEDTVTEAGIGISVFSAKKNFKDAGLFLADMQELYSKLPLDNKKEMKLEYKSGIGLFINSRRISAKIPLSGVSVSTVLKSIASEDKEIINKIVSVSLPEEQAQSIIDMDLDSWVESIDMFFKQYFGVVVRINAPDENFSTNKAMFDENNPKSAVWLFSAENDESTFLAMSSEHKSDMQQMPAMNNELIWVSESPNITGIVISSVLLLAIIIFLIIKFGRRPKKDADGIEADSDESLDSVLGADDYQDFSEIGEAGEEPEITEDDNENPIEPAQPAAKEDAPEEAQAADKPQVAGEQNQEEQEDETQDKE